MLPIRCTFVALVLIPLGFLQATEPLVIGTHKQLLVDDLVIDQMTEITRELGQVTKANNGKPVFTDGRFYGTVPARRKGACESKSRTNRVSLPPAFH